MDAENMNVKKEPPPILSWIMLILGALLFLPGGFYCFFSGIYSLLGTPDGSGVGSLLSFWYKWAIPFV